MKSMKVMKLMGKTLAEANTHQSLGPLRKKPAGAGAGFAATRGEISSWSTKKPALKRPASAVEKKEDENESEDETMDRNKMYHFKTHMEEIPENIMAVYRKGGQLKKRQVVNNIVKLNSNGKAEFHFENHKLVDVVSRFETVSAKDSRKSMGQLRAEREFGGKNKVDEAVSSGELVKSYTDKGAPIYWERQFEIAEHKGRTEKRSLTGSTCNLPKEIADFMKTDLISLEFTINFNKSQTRAIDDGKMPGQVLENLKIGSSSITKGIERAEKMLGSMQVTTDGGARAKQTAIATKMVKGVVFAEKKCISKLKIICIANSFQ